MSHPYDASKYRALGIGETVKGSHLLWNNINGYASEMPVSYIGTIVSDEERMSTFLEALPNKDTYPSGAARSASAGRGRFDLLPWEGMVALAKRYEEGAQRFGDQNWRKGVPLSRILSSMRRHASQVGYDFTEDHAAAVAWNAFAWITMCELVRRGEIPAEIDDLGVTNKEVVR